MFEHNSSSSNVIGKALSEAPLAKNRLSRVNITQIPGKEKALMGDTRIRRMILGAAARAST
jgi:hypothetical protein